MKVNDPEVVETLRRERAAQGLPALDSKDPTALQVLDDLLRNDSATGGSQPVARHAMNKIRPPDPLAGSKRKAPT
jgi:hypothetical protein